jgi:hypothetical protein
VAGNMNLLKAIGGSKLHIQALLIKQQ